MVKSSFRLYGGSIVSETKPELYEDFILLKGLELDKVYQVSVVAVDGAYSIESDVEEIDTHRTGVVSIFSLFTQIGVRCSIKVYLSIPFGSVELSC